MELNSENIFKLPEGKIIFNSVDKTSDYHSDTDFNALIDKDIKEHKDGGFFMSYNPKSWFEFEIPQKSKIYAYSYKKTYDSAGSSPQPINLYRFVENDFVLYKSNVQTYIGEWYVLFNNLPKGRYKVTTNKAYVNWSEWFVEMLSNDKILLRQNNQLYTIKNEFYENNQYKLLDCQNLFSDTFIRYGFDDISDMCKEIKYIKKNGDKKDIDEGKLFEFDLNGDFNDINVE